MLMNEETPEMIGGFRNEEMVVEFFERLSELETKVAKIERILQPLLDKADEGVLEDATNASTVTMAEKRMQEQLSSIREEVKTQIASMKKAVVNQTSAKMFTYEKCSLPEYRKTGLRLTGFKGFEEKEVTIPEEIGGVPVISLGCKLFVNSMIVRIVLPDTIVELGEECFKGSKNLCEVGLSSKLKSIGANCFSDCINLSAMLLPDSVKEVGNSAFYASGIQRISFSKNITEIPGYCCAGCAQLAEVIIPEGIKEISYNAFSYSGSKETQLRSIIIPKSVEKVGKEVFENRKNLKIAFLGEQTSVEKSFSGRDEDLFGFRNSKPEGSILYVVPGSEMHKYAQEHGIPVKPLSEYSM